jgi:hypothetical protein
MRRIERQTETHKETSSSFTVREGLGSESRRRREKSEAHLKAGTKKETKKSNE